VKNTLNYVIIDDDDKRFSTPLTEALTLIQSKLFDINQFYQEAKILEVSHTISYLIRELQVYMKDLEILLRGDKTILNRLSNDIQYYNEIIDNHYKNGEIKPDQVYLAVQDIISSIGTILFYLNRRFDDSNEECESEPDDRSEDGFE